MFGFGSKKEKQPDKRWMVQVLTTEYLIEGQLPADEDFFILCQQEHPAESIEALTQVRIQATGLLTVPDQALSTWYPAFGKTMVAFIPRDTESLELARQTYEDYTTSTRVQLFAGPYLIQGMLLNEGDHDINFEDPSGFMPVTNAEITHLLSGASLRGHRVPWMLVNGDWVHGYVVIGN